MLRTLVNPLVMRTYTPRGRKLGLSCRIRLVYGLLGFAFLCFTATWSVFDRAGNDDSLVPPTAWYWSWIPHGDSGPSHGGAGTVNESESGPLIESEESQLLQREAEPQTEVVSRRGSPWGTDRQGRSLRWIMGEGAADYLVKPLSAEALIECVNRILKKH